MTYLKKWPARLVQGRRIDHDESRTHDKVPQQGPTDGFRNLWDQDLVEPFALFRVFEYYGAKGFAVECAIRLRRGLLSVNISFGGG